MTDITQGGRFAVVPVNVIQDSRLTLEQLRVLVALLSFANNESDVVWPKRDALAKRTGGMHPANISAATAALERFGWVEKEGKGGFGKPVRYRLKLSTTVAEPTTVAERATVAESANTTVAESATRKELTSELTKELSKTGLGSPPNPPKPKFDASAINPLPANVPREVWAEFVAHRRDIKQPMTERAANMLLKKLAKFTDPATSLETSIANGWTGVFDQRSAHHGKPSNPLNRIRNAYVQETGLETVGAHD
jgi:hypothetical protein